MYRGRFYRGRFYRGKNDGGKITFVSRELKESDVKNIDSTEKGLYSSRAVILHRRLLVMAEAHKAREWMTTTEATIYLGISSKTMTRLIREGVVETHNHPLDRRKKLVRCADITALKQAAERLAA